MSDDRARPAGGTPDGQPTTVGAPHATGASSSDTAPPDLQRELIRRLLAESPTAELMHVLLVVAMAVLFWGRVSMVALGLWVTGVLAAAVFRAAHRRRAATSGAADQAALHGVRVGVLLTGLAWAVAPPVLAFGLPLEELVFLMVVFAGLVAGATSTLLADARSFYGFALTMLGPLAVTLLAHGQSRGHVVAFLLTLLFGATMAVVYRRSHAQLVAYLGTLHRVERSEAAATRERAHLEALLDSAPTAIAAVQADGSVLRVNPAFASLFGYGESEVLGRDLNSLIVPEGEQERATALDQSVRAGQVVVDEVKRCRKGGECFWVQVSAAPVRDAAAAGTWFVLYEDVSARRQAELALREAEEQYRVLVESASDLVWEVDREGRWTFLNAACKRVYGLSVEEMLGRPFAERVDPDQLEQDFAAFGRVLEGGELTDFETVHRHADGSERFLSYAAHPIRDAAGHVVGARGIARDITERKAAEEELRKLSRAVEASPAAVVVTDRHGIIEYVNPRFTEMTGYAADEAVGQNPRILSSGKQSREFYRELWETILDGREWRGEFLNRSKQGAEYWELASISPIKAPDGEITHFVAVKEDITERKRVAVELAAAKDAAEAANRAKSAFLANMSHEIRTPMNGVLGMTELLLETELSREQRQSAELIRSSAEALLAIINDVLDFSKIEAGHLTVEEIPFDLHAVVDATVRLLAVRAFERGIELAYDVQPDVPRAVMGDPGRLRQVLNNLIGNAVKFTHDGEVVVTVSAADGSAEPNGIRFSVRDTGIGIPQDKLEHIFEEFSQADVSTTRRYGGTGLGLAISRRIVEMMGGILEVTSEVDAGSEFHFTVPLAAAPDGVAHSLGRERASLDGAAVLIVDDNETNRRILREVLGKAGATIDEAEDGDVALATLTAGATAGRPFDLAVIDAYMPGRGGFELAAAVREHAKLKDVRLMMLTSAGERGDAERCRQLGIRAYLTKPVAGPDLIEVAAAVLSGRDVDGVSTLITRHSIEETRRHLRILLAEDNPVNQQVAATMLRKRGHDVDIVGDGRSAVEAVARGHYDVVLMDIQMPELDGLSATREIRADAQRAELPIIAMTAHAMTSDVERCLEAGMDDHIAKPFKPHDLFAKVEGWDHSGEDAAPATSPPSDVPPVDLDGFRAALREAGIEDALGNMLDVFLADAPARLTALDTAVAAHDGEAVRQAAHAYKSAAGTVWARALAELLRQAEEAGRESDLGHAASLVEEIRLEHARVLRHLNAQGSED